MQPNAEKSQERAQGGGLRRMLSDDHERLERLFADLLEAFKADAREDAARLWGEFDVGLRTHLSLEEQHIFPHFGKVHAAEVAALQREHEQIRDTLLELGIGVDLHLTNDEKVERFIRELRGHAAREDALLYQWAARELHPEAESPLRSWLSKVLNRTSNVQSSPTRAENTGDRT